MRTRRSRRAGPGQRPAGSALRQPEVRPGQPAQGPGHGLSDRLGVPPRRPAGRGHQGVRGLAAGARRRRHHRLGAAARCSAAAARRWCCRGSSRPARPAPTAALRDDDSESARAVAEVEAGVIANIIAATAAGAACRSTTTAATSSRRSSGASTRTRSSSKRVDAPARRRQSYLVTSRTTTSIWLMLDALGRLRQAVDADGIAGNIEQLAFCLDEEVVVVRRVGVEVGRAARRSPISRSRPARLN